MTNNFNFDFDQRSEGQAVSKPETQGTMGADLNPRPEAVKTTSEAELELTSTVSEVLGMHGEAIRKLADR
jgi:death on curing protein